MLGANVATSGRCGKLRETLTFYYSIKQGQYTGSASLRFLPLTGITEQQLADAAQLSSLADKTPEGRSIYDTGKTKIQFT